MNRSFTFAFVGDWCSVDYIGHSLNLNAIIAWTVLNYMAQAGGRDESSRMIAGNDYSLFVRQLEQLKPILVQLINVTGSRTRIVWMQQSPIVYSSNTKIAIKIKYTFRYYYCCLYYSYLDRIASIMLLLLLLLQWKRSGDLGFCHPIGDGIHPQLRHFRTIRRLLLAQLFRFTPHWYSIHHYPLIFFLNND